MNDDADAISLATNVLIQLFGNRFRQWEVTINRCGKRDLYLKPTIGRKTFSNTWMQVGLVTRYRYWIFAQNKW